MIYYGAKRSTTPKGFNMLNGLDKIEGLTPELQAQINLLAQGLVDKNNDLLGKLSAGKQDGVTGAAELEALRVFKQNSDVSAAESAQSYTDAKQLTADAHAAELLKSNGRGDVAEAQLKTLLIDNGLSAALDAVDINKSLKAGAVAMLQAGAIITDGKAMIGDKSLSDAVKEWAETDAGKAFCLAPNNSGGGAEGGNTPAGGKKFSELTLTEKTQLLNTDPEKYNLLKG